MASEVGESLILGSLNRRDRRATERSSMGRGIADSSASGPGSYYLFVKRRKIGLRRRKLKTKKPGVWWDAGLFEVRDFKSQIAELKSRRYTDSRSKITSMGKTKDSLMVLKAFSVMGKSLP